MAGKKNGKKPADPKKIARAAGLGVMTLGVAMIAFAAWFIWQALESVSTADLGKRTSGAKVEGINVPLLESLLAGVKTKTADANKLPDKVRDSFSLAPAAPEPKPAPAGSDLVPCPPPPPGTPPAPAGTPPCMMPAAELNAILQAEQQQQQKPPTK